MPAELNPQPWKKPLTVGSSPTTPVSGFKKRKLRENFNKKKKQGKHELRYPTEVYDLA